MRSIGTCKSAVCKAIDVCTPIVLETVAHVDDIVVKCCDEQVICIKKKCCSEMCVYELAVRQKIFVEIPLRYTAEVRTDASHIDC